MRWTRKPAAYNHKAGCTMKHLNYDAVLHVPCVKNCCGVHENVWWKLQVAASMRRLLSLWSPNGADFLLFLCDTCAEACCLAQRAVYAKMMSCIACITMQAATNWQQSSAQPADHMYTSTAGLIPAPSTSCLLKCITGRASCAFLNVPIPI